MHTNKHGPVGEVIVEGYIHEETHGSVFEEISVGSNKRQAFHCKNCDYTYCECDYTDMESHYSAWLNGHDVQIKPLDGSNDQGQLLNCSIPK